jgi:NAD(P)-dependent dehydrogenase (short-subunit alcohol dehydrogenase family)
LGRAFALALARAGADVVVVARSRAELDETVAEIGSQARAFALDVTDSDAVRRVFGEIGPVDVLMNNAGVLGSIGPFAQSNFDEWWRAMEVNVRGAMACTHAVLGGMIARGSGRIINIVTGAFSAAHLSPYLASKTALVRATECLAIEMKESGVALFSVAPGTVRTNMSVHSLSSDEGRRWIPWFQQIFEQGLDLPAERPAALIVALASGKYDALSGLFISPFDDLDAMVAERARIGQERLHVLSIRPREVSAEAAARAAVRPK